jgi:ribosome-binding protein aMBF1 (putative translation factor)
MKLNTIQALGGQRYVLLPLEAYTQLEPQITAVLKQTRPSARVRKPRLETKPAPAIEDTHYSPFALDEYVRNPVALARIKAGLTQVELAKQLGVSQPYVAKLEAQSRVSKQKLADVMAVFETLRINEK